MKQVVKYFTFTCVVLSVGCNDSNDELDSVAPTKAEVVEAKTAPLVKSNTPKKDVLSDAKEQSSSDTSFVIEGGDETSLTKQRANMLEQIKKQIRAKFDKDGDGILSEQEEQLFQSAIAKMKKAMAGKGTMVSSGNIHESLMLKRFDKDGDGELSEDERQQAKKDEADHQKNTVMQFDKDGDGELSDEEKADQDAMKKQVMTSFFNAEEHVRTMQMRKYDKDGNGKLSSEERAQANKNFGKDLQKQMRKSTGEEVKVITEVIEVESESSEVVPETPNK